MSDRKILLKETKDFMQDHYLKPSDVLYCKTEKYKFPWIVFKRAAMISYDSGYGLAEINLNLEIHGCTEGHRWVTFRREYDGSEWWDWVVDHTEGLIELTEKDLSDIMEKEILTPTMYHKWENTIKDDLSAIINKSLAEGDNAWQMKKEKENHDHE